MRYKVLKYEKSEAGTIVTVEYIPPWWYFYNKPYENRVYRFKHMLAWRDLKEGCIVEEKLQDAIHAYEARNGL